MPEYIEKEKLKEALCPYSDTNYAQDMETILRIVDEFPAADVAPVVHGRWDAEGDGYAETSDGEMAPVIDVWYCSKCGYCIDEGIDDKIVLPNYCPNCGAKMDLE